MRIQDVRTSNHNETIHSVRWSMVHKNEPASFENMQLGEALAVEHYNDGWNGISEMCDVLGITSTGSPFGDRRIYSQDLRNGLQKS